jgi:hypothetical protein
VSLDSTAELLFKINADSDDAENNIARFRTLMGKDLDDIGAEFEVWSDKVLGSLSTVQGAMMAGGAVIGTALVAAGAAAVEASSAYVDYVSEISHGSQVTGIAVEDMSTLHFATKETGGSYEALTRGMVKFESEVAKSNQTAEGRIKLAQELGVSEKQVADGMTNIMPLLGAVSDHYNKLAGNSERAAFAREHFGRGFAGMIGDLKLGSDGLKKMAEEAQKFGLTVSPEEQRKVLEYKTAVNAYRNEMEALDHELGKNTLPVMMTLKLAWAATMATITDKKNWQNLESPLEQFDKKLYDISKRALELAKAMTNQGGKPDEDSGLPKPEKVAKVRQEYTALADVLETVKERLASSLGGQAHIDEEIEHLQFEVSKATDKFNELRKAGELAPKAVQAGLSAIAQLPLALQNLTEQLTEAAHAKTVEEFSRYGDELRQQIAAQGSKSEADEQARWNAEIARRREHLASVKELEVGQRAALSAEIDQLQKAGDAKIAREHTQALTDAAEDLWKRIAGQQEKGLGREKQAWAAEIEDYRRHLFEKSELTKGNMLLLMALDAAGQQRIDAKQKSEFDLELTNLRSHLARILEAEMTQEQKLKAEYDRDVANYGRAQMEKVIQAKGGEAARAGVEAEYAAIHAALLKKYGNDLNALKNSQGWQGVFGSHFASQIKQNENLMKEWETSTNRAAMSVQVAMESLKQALKDAFDQWAQGMGQGIASAIVYSKSIKQAMEAATASTLESLGARALTNAIYYMADGFGLLASQMYEPAADAFTAAAIFGSVGVGAAIAGRAMTPKQAQGAGAGAGQAPGMTPGSGGVSRGSGGGYGSGGGNGQQAPHATVNIYGHVIGTSGISELTSMINDAVLNQDVTLTSTNTKTGVQVTR